MKKAIKIGAFVFAGALLLASCKKDWTCKCTNGADVDYHPINNLKKKDAKGACDVFHALELIDGGSCELQK